MANSPEASEFQAKLRRLELLIQQSEKLTDNQARTHMREVVQALLDLHSTGLERVMNHVAVSEAGNEMMDAFIADEVVAGLLMLHGLHPLSTEERVRQALEEIQPDLQSHGSQVLFVEMDNGKALLRLESQSQDCQSSAAAMRQMIEEAIYAKAPDVTAVEIEGLDVVTDGAMRIALPLL